MKFKEFKQLRVKVPKTQVMETKKHPEFQIVKVLVDIDEIVYCQYCGYPYETDPQEFKEIQKYCEENNFILVNLITKQGVNISNIIEPSNNYFNTILKIQ